MTRNLIVAAALLLSATTANGQNFENTGDKPFSHLAVGVTLGTTGVGVDVSAPLTDFLNVRTGFEVMPHFERTMTFGIQSFGSDGEISNTRFEKMASFLESFTGYHADSEVDMIGKPVMWNYKLLFDIFPFRNKHWHITAGFHWGPKKVAEAVNSLDDAPSLSAVNMYNHLYYIADQDLNHDNLIPLIDHNGYEMYLDPTIEDKLLEIGWVGIGLGTYTHDVVDADGNIVHHEGDVYRMTPDGNSKVTCEVHTNSFKPYLGFGYDGQLLKKDKTVRIGFDCGLMFWGGTPSVVTHDGTDLAKDVTGIGGKVGSYVDFIDGLKVFPVINLRVTKTIF